MRVVVRDMKVLMEEALAYRKLALESSERKEKESSERISTFEMPTICPHSSLFLSILYWP